MTSRRFSFGSRTELLEYSRIEVRRHAKVNLALFTQHHIDMMDPEKDAVVAAFASALDEDGEGEGCRFPTIFSLLHVFSKLLFDLPAFPRRGLFAMSEDIFCNCP